MSSGVDITGYGFFREVTALPFVGKVVLFGSRARGDHHDRSDIDLAVFCDGASEDGWLEVLDCLRADRIDTLLKVDCVRFDECGPALQEHVLVEGTVLYEKAGSGRKTDVCGEDGRTVSETKLRDRIRNAERCLRRLEDAAATPLDDRLMNLDATVHRFNTSFETLMRALDTCLRTVQRLSAEERGRSRFALLEAGFRMGLIDDDQVWTRIRKARNATSCEYDRDKAMALYREILCHVPHLRRLLERIRSGEDGA